MKTLCGPTKTGLWVASLTSRKRGQKTESRSKTTNYLFYVITNQETSHNSLSLCGRAPAWA